MLTEEDYEAVADAYQAEFDRWIYRDATWTTENKGRDGHEVCQFDESGYAGKFSIIYRYPTARVAEAALDKTRRRFAARAAVAAYEAIK